MRARRATARWLRSAGRGAPCDARGLAAQTTRRQRAGHRRARRGTDDCDARRGELGCRTRPGPASPSRRATAAGQNRSAEERVGGTDRSRVRGRQSCRARMHHREIADKLFISPHTVNAHVRHVFEKLGVNSRVHLTRLVADRSVSSPRDPRAVGPQRDSTHLAVRLPVAGPARSRRGAGCRLAGR